jgi:hypothetical protein
VVSVDLISNVRYGWNRRVSYVDDHHSQQTEFGDGGIAMSDETVVMNTVKINRIQGTINGIAEDDFEALEIDMRRYFRNVRWEKERLYIDNKEAEPYLGTFDQVENLLARIADHIPEGKYGKLGFIGLLGKREIVAIIFMKRKHWEMKEFTRPELPDWYKAEEWYQKERWEEEIMWDELFGS